MRKPVSFLLLLFAVCINSVAQSTISYGQISCFCPQTGQTLAGESAVAITFYDGYILHPLYGKLQAAQQNFDGSTTYIPLTFAGTPAVQLNAVLVSSDLQRMEERMTSTMGNMSFNMINQYTSMGEDGGAAAERWMNAQAVSRRGGTYSDRDQRSSTSCPRCHGTGIDSSPNCVDNPHAGANAAAQGLVGYTHTSSSRCKYCGNYNYHIHYKCYNSNYH